MTEQLQTDTADETGTPDAGLPQDGAAPGASFIEGLNGDNRRVVDAKGWDSLDKVVESYRNLEAKIGDSLRAPDADAPAEEWNEFYGRLGRPETPEGYAFTMPEGLAEDFPYDGESASRFAEWAHQAGLSTRQAQSVHDHFVQRMSDEFSAQRTSDAEQADAAHAALVEAWGDPSSEGYRRNLELASRGLRALGGEALEAALKRRGAITQDGEVAEPEIAFMLHKAGTLFAEDRVVAGAGGGRNPFARETENITEQGHMLRTDPELARTQIRAANRERDFPRLFGAEF